MEIKEVEVYKLHMKLKEPFETSFGSVHMRPVVLLRVRDKSGEEGWGEVVAGEGPWYSYETIDTALIVLDKYLIPLVLRKFKGSARDLWNLMERIRGHNTAKAGLEMAIWDLEARLANLPLYKYIGGSKRRIPSGVSIGVKKRIEDLIRDISKRLEEGYLRIKIKIKPGWDLKVIKSIRKEYPDIPLQVDANSAYTLKDTSLLKKLDNFDLLMIEQPLHYEDLVGHAILSRKLTTPICLDESIRSIHDTRAAYILNSARIINIKPGRVGGYTPSIMIHDFCGIVGMSTWVGGMLETGIGRGHLLALASLKFFTLPNDISASSRYWERDIVEPEWSLEDGYIEIPESPGIGVDILVDRIKVLSEVSKKYH